MRVYRITDWIRTGGLLYFVAFLLAGCANFSPPPPMVQTGMDELLEETGETAKEEMRPATGLPPLAKLEPMMAVEEAMPYEGKLFSLSARNTPLRDVLLGVAKEADLNLVIEKGVDSAEPVSVEMHDLPLKTALDSFLSSYNYFYSIKGNILLVKAMETRIFHFNYPLHVTSPKSSVGGDMLGGGQSDSAITGEFTLDTEVEKDYLDVWKQIVEALKPFKEAQPEAGGILSAQGRAQLNKMSGMIMVTDRQENLKAVDDFLGRIQSSLRRQVILEAKILEVTLNDSHQFGIDWNFIANNLFGTGDLTFKTSNVATTIDNSLKVITLTEDTSGKDTFAGFLQMLNTQGTVNVLSSPRLNVLNNQSALINVGSTIPYLAFQVQSTPDPANASNTITTIVPNVETAQKGVSLGVTPQIDEDGIVTLHITPVITDSSTNETFTYDGNTWNVPIIDVQATDTVIRAKDGTTVVLGGLIKEKVTDTERSLPFFGKLPLFGKYLFTGEYRTSEKKELVILLTPNVVVQ